MEIEEEEEEYFFFNFMKLLLQEIAQTNLRIVFVHSIAENLLFGDRF